MTTRKPREINFLVNSPFFFSVFPPQSCLFHSTRSLTQRSPSSSLVRPRLRQYCLRDVTHAALLVHFTNADSAFQIHYKKRVDRRNVDTVANNTVMESTLQEGKHAIKKDTSRTFAVQRSKKKKTNKRATKSQWHKNRRIHTAIQNESNSDSNEEFYFHSVRNLPPNATEAYAKLKIGNKQGRIFVNAKIDAGAMSNLLQKAVFKKLPGIQHKKTPI